MKNDYNFNPFPSLFLTFNNSQSERDIDREDRSDRKEGYFSRNFGMMIAGIFFLEFQIPNSNMTDTFINNNISHISSTQQTDGGRNNLFCIQVLTLLGNKIPLRLACTLLYSTLPLMSHVDKNGNPWKWKSNVSRKTNEQQKEVVQKYS